VALDKINFPINFSQGLNGKSDPFQIQPGQFQALENTVFTKQGMLQKRNGYGALKDLPDTSSTYLTTFNGNLTAVGTSLLALSNSSNTWVNKGSLLPVELDVLPLIRSNLSQTQCDASVSSNGLVCTVFTDTGGGVSPQYKYAVANAVTGQNIIAPTVISDADSTYGTPRVFVLGNYFMVVYTNVVTGTYHLKYIAISVIDPTNISAATDITTQYTPATTVAWDGVVVNNSLYLAWNASDVGGAIRMKYITATLTQSSNTVFTTRVATMMSLTADTTQSSPVIYASFYDSSGSTGYVLAVNQQLSTILSPTQWISAVTVLNVTSSAENGSCTIIYEVSNAYSYDGAIPTNFTRYRTCTQGGSLGTATTVLRSVGLASKSFILNSTIYFLVTYQSPYQNTYFLITTSGAIVAKLAYSNGRGYLTHGLPGISISNNIAQISYLFKDLVQSVNKGTNVPSGTQTAGIYTQLGINLASFTIGTSAVSSAEIGNNLHLSGGFLWSYDGYLPVEHGFHLYPDSVKATWSATGGSIHAQPDGATNTNAYYYQVTYEWTDNQGNAFKSAPSIPIAVTTTGSGTAGSITVNVPTLRLTYKIANPVKIVIYRWSVAQQTYYQVTSITSPTLNSTSSDSIAYVDTLADSSILGNTILYTTGGVIENIEPPSTKAMTLYQSRLFLIDAENPNTLWFSKQVIQSTPVEMSDLFTIYIAPTVGAQGSTGDMKCIAALDDKLIIFKRDAIYYLTGNGPDNTGANNDFSQPIFITSTVGCSNPRSIVFMPQGLMFQSDKGIWLLGRDLSTSYIGAPVENFNDLTVLSAFSVPGTNQVRFTLSGGITLMYDYYYGQWGTFTNIPAISSTLYQNLHTYINSFGKVFQENVNSYLDGASPVLISFTTSWFNLAGLQGYERAYELFLLGVYYTPHKLNVGISYDYNLSLTQNSVINPINFSPAYGNDTLYGGGSPYGGPNSLEQWRIFLQRQRCESFAITLKESFDPSYGTTPGKGFTLSGINVTAGIKKTRPVLPARQSVG